VTLEMALSPAFFSDNSYMCCTNDSTNALSSINGSKIYKQTAEGTIIDDNLCNNW